MADVFTLLFLLIIFIHVIIKDHFRGLCEGTWEQTDGVTMTDPIDINAIL